MRRWPGRPELADPGLAAGLVAVQLGLLLIGPREVRPSSWPVAIAGTVVAVLPVAVRRWRLEWAVASTVPLTVGWLWFPALDPVTITIVVLTYTAAAHRRLRRATGLAAAMWLTVIAVQALVPNWASRMQVTMWSAFAADVLVALVSFFIGRTVHNRRAYTEALEERTRVAEENLRSLAEQAVADERRRIARELHDVVAHHVSVMGVLATGARRVLARDPEVADETLGTIEETGRTALRELRRLLTILRTDAEPAAELTPQPGLAGIEALVDQVREAGLPVTLRAAGLGRRAAPSQTGRPDGEPGPLDPGVALTVYRIVQEALTNTLKHAGPATAEVRLDVGRQWLLLEVLDTGRGPGLAGAKPGHGLLGMRERVALYGGALRTGPRPGGGFRVSARIPLDQTDSGGRA